MNEYLVLVVEDDKPIRNLITTTLKMNDYRFITAVRGNEAIMLSASHKPDIIILDLGLPDIDGVEVIEHIRTWSDVPIIIVSARSEERDKITALDKGADDYLTKPFSVDELLARLRVIQRRLMKSENISVTEFVNGRLRIDYVSGCVHLDDEEIHLTPIEYKLLCLLAKNVGKVLHEKSCGAIVYRKYHGNTEILLIKHINSGHWSFPKGHVEGDETEEETAKREIMEETGIDVNLDTTFREIVSYSPRKDTQKIVVYFIGKAKNTDYTPQEEEIADIRWVEIGRAGQVLSYENDRSIVNKAKKFII